MADSKSRGGRTALVTVGTTKFDALMREVGRAEFARALRARGFSRLVVQHGNGGIVPELDAARAAGLDVECFAFRDDFGSVLAASDLVVGHAGAGTILESLRAGKLLIVVTNETLMDNHQAEIAEEMARRGYAVHCSPGHLVAALGSSETDALRPYPDADPGQLVQTLDTL